DLGDGKRFAALLRSVPRASSRGAPRRPLPNAREELDDACLDSIALPATVAADGVRLHRQFGGRASVHRRTSRAKSSVVPPATAPVRKKLCPASRRSFTVPTSGSFIGRRFWSDEQAVKRYFAVLDLAPLLLIKGPPCLDPSERAFSGWRASSPV